MATAESAPILSRERALKDADDAVRQGFVRKVYGILSVQLLLTVAIAAPIVTMSKEQVASNQWMLLVATGMLMVTMLTTCCCSDLLKKYPTNYAILFALTVGMSVVVGFTSAMYTWQSVALAAGITTVIFVGMTIFAWTTKIDFTGYGLYLFAAMMTLMAFSLVLSVMCMFMGAGNIKWMIMFYDFGAVLLFTFFIVYDTQLMLGGSHQVQLSIDDYCFAALNLYLDIINLFLHLLSLLGERR